MGKCAKTCKTDTDVEHVYLGWNLTVWIVLQALFQQVDWFEKTLVQKEEIPGDSDRLGKFRVKKAIPRDSPDPVVMEKQSSNSEMAWIFYLPVISTQSWSWSCRRQRMLCQWLFVFKTVLSRFFLGPGILHERFLQGPHLTINHEMEISNGSGLFWKCKSKEEFR